MPASSRPESITVALVEGDPEWTEQMSKDLTENLGARVTVSPTCDLVHLNGKSPHVVVIGCGADPGFEWLRRVRQEHTDRKLPVIVAGDDEEDDQQIEASRAGANAYLDCNIHKDASFLEKLVYGLAHE